MRYVHVADGLRLRFPGRDEEFRQGVEIGILVMLLDRAQPEFSHSIHPDNLGQARALAEQFGYRLTSTQVAPDLVDLKLRNRTVRPKLALVTPLAG